MFKIRKISHLKHEYSKSQRCSLVYRKLINLYDYTRQEFNIKLQLSYFTELIFCLKCCYRYCALWLMYNWTCVIFSLRSSCYINIKATDLQPPLVIFWIPKPCPTISVRFHKTKLNRNIPQCKIVPWYINGVITSKVLYCLLWNKPTRTSYIKITCFLYQTSFKVSAKIYDLTCIYSPFGNL